MKRVFALLCALFCIVQLSGCEQVADLLKPDLANPLPEQSTEEEPEEPAEPEGSKAVTLVFAHAIDEGRAALLEAAQQIADAEGYTLSTVETLGRQDLQSRFVELARDAGEQVILIELISAEEGLEIARAAGDMAVVFLDVQPSSHSALGKRAIYVGNPEGGGESYLRLTGRTAMRAAHNLVMEEAADKDTELKLSGNKITVPADGVLPV